MLGENVQKLVSNGAGRARGAGGFLAVPKAGLGGEVLRRIPQKRGPCGEFCPSLLPQLVHGGGWDQPRGGEERHHPMKSRKS